MYAFLTRLKYIPGIYITNLPLKGRFFIPNLRQCPGVTSVAPAGQWMHLCHPVQPYNIKYVPKDTRKGCAENFVQLELYARTNLISAMPSIALVIAGKL